MTARVLGVDPGEKRIGLAVSDPSGTIANPYGVVQHVSRPVDAASIAQVAVELQVGLIVIGQSLDDNGEETIQSRRAGRLAEAIAQQTDIPVKMWDEFGSTREARAARIAMGVSRKRRAGHLDQLAATVILQSYLDAQTESS